MTPPRVEDYGDESADDLRRLWARAPKLDEAASETERSVVRWEWFNWSSSLEPFDSERNDFPRPRRLREPPTEVAWVSRCGFDEHGRAVAQYSYGSSTHVALRNFHFFEGDRCKRLNFGEDGELSSVLLYEYEGGRLVRARGYAESFPGEERWSVEDYAYDADGRPASVHSRSSGGDYPDEEKERIRAGYVDTFEYDERGKLLAIKRRSAWPGAAERVVYKRRTKGVSRTQLKRRVTDMLTEAIRAEVARCPPQETVWCLALQYEASAPFPPELVFGSERERTEWGPEVDLLNPAEWEADDPPRRLKLTDPALLEECTTLWSEISANATAERQAADLLNDVAKRLNEPGLDPALPVTEDFFVYAVDVELEHLERNLRRTLARPAYRALQRAGLVE